MTGERVGACQFRFGIREGATPVRNFSLLSQPDAGVDASAPSGRPLRSRLRQIKAPKGAGVGGPAVVERLWARIELMRNPEVAVANAAESYVGLRIYPHKIWMSHCNVRIE